MRKSVFLGGLVAASMVFGASAADAQRSSIFKPRPTDPNAPDPTQLSTDVSQYSPEAQIGKIARNTDLLVRENEQIRAELARAMEKLDELEKRGESLNRILTTGTGEYLGSMVRKIKDKVVGPY